jgi:hypothetical protein
MDLKKGISVLRLQSDLKEVLTNPIPNVAALPLEDDLYVWHGNGKPPVELELTYEMHVADMPSMSHARLLEGS